MSKLQQDLRKVHCSSYARKGDICTLICALERYKLHFSRVQLEKVVRTVKCELKTRRQKRT